METIWNSNALPQDFAAVLFEDEEDSEAEEIEEEYVNDNVNYENLTYFETGFEDLLENPLNMTPEDSFDSFTHEFEDIDLEIQESRETDNPLPPMDSIAPPRFSIEVQVERHIGRRGGTYSARGRGRGLRGGLRRGGWMRGQALSQVYINDSELPETLRYQIRQIISRRNRQPHNRQNNLGEESLNWHAETFLWQPIDSWQGCKEIFTPEKIGPTQNFEGIYDAFRAIWDNNILSHIVTETNRYAQNFRGEFQRTWVPTNCNEILLLFCFWMMLGIIKMPSISSCFSKIPILKTSVFRQLFTEKRYWRLNKAFHLANGSSDPYNPGNSLYPMGPVLDHLNSRFKELYCLEQDICIDESLTLWKGPLGFKQYIKSKSARFGIKTYQLCESSTGYLWSFFVYVGRATSNSSCPASVSTVLQLIRPLLNLGHVLYMDNFFNSPELARYLKKNRTDCVGTLRANRKNVPVIIQKCPLAEGHFIARQSGDVMVVAFQDRKRVTCLSTYHDMSQTQTSARSGRSSQFKLNLIADYNFRMGGVDRLDQMLEPYLIERKQCRKWSKKLFKRLLNISIQNARILYEKSNNTKIDSLVFRLTLVQEIIKRHLSGPLPTSRLHANNIFSESRLTERHFIRLIPITQAMRQKIKFKNNMGRKNCVLCYKNGQIKKTRYECPSCEVPLCLEECFRIFHTTK